ncbi:MAG: hypothetical protein ACR2NP_04630 [Pirellulaceae bacterium]
MNTTDVPQIDFAKYRTPELYESVVNLINVPGRIRLVAGYAFLGAMILAIAGVVLLFLRGGGSSLIVLVPLLVSSFAGGLIAGTVFGIAEVIRRGMGNLLQIVDVLLEITGKIATDMSDVAGGEKQLPPAGQLVREVYRHVMLPVVEQAVSEIFGVFSKPVFFLYRMTLGRLVRVVDRLIPEGEASTAEEKEQTGQFASNVQQGLQSVADNELRIVQTLNWVRGKIVSIGGWLKVLVMLPCYVVCAIFLALALAPIIAIWILLADTAGEDAAGEQTAMLLIWLSK